MTKTLKSFARQQEKKAAEESTGETTQTESTTDESETEETESTDEESDETETTEEETSDSEEESDGTETTATETPAPAASGTLPPGYIGVNASELKVLQEKAGKWDAAEGEYKTLKNWYANTIQIGASAKEDVSTTTAKGAKNDVYSQPWNAKAQEVAESSK